MQNLEIYEHALALLSLSPEDGENGDLAERAPYHLAAFCSEAEEVDRWLSPTDEAPSFHRIRLSLDEEFPLCERLAPVAALYLASLLILDEDPEHSDRLYERYGEAMSDLRMGLPATLESITERYL